MTDVSPKSSGSGKLFWFIGILLACLLTALSILISVSATRRVQSPVQAKLDFPIPDFRLPKAGGSNFGTSDMAGRVWIVNFVFTRCPGPCFRMSQEMVKLQKTFANRPDVGLLTVTVDPDFDTPAILKAYADTLGANLTQWTFVTGEKSVVYDLIQRGFKLPVEELEVPNEDGPIAHSTRFVAVDGQGQIRGYFDGMIEEQRAALVSMINSLTEDNL